MTTSTDNSTSLNASGAVQVSAKKPRGFAAMPRKTVSAIAAKGGRAAHAKGTSYKFTHEAAQRAGRLGGLAMQANAIEKRAVIRDLERRVMEPDSQLVRVDVYEGDEP